MKYSITLTDVQIRNIYEITDNKEKQSKIMSILQYMIKYSNCEFKLTKSLNKLFEMYSTKGWKYHKKLSRAYFYKIAKMILDNNFFINEVDKKVDKKVDKNKSTSCIENTDVEQDLNWTNNIITNNNTNTNTNIVMSAENIFAYLKKSYKGISGNPTLSKSELKKIAKGLFVLRGVHEAHIQNWVFSKIEHSFQKIQSAGALSYINAIITDKLVESSNYICI